MDLLKKKVDAALSSEQLQSVQMDSAATIVSQFVLVRDALQSQGVSADVNLIAATLTAGIWASPVPPQ